MPINIIKYNILYYVLRTTTVHETKSFSRPRKKRTGDESIASENMLRAAGSKELNKFVCARALGQTSPDW